MFIICPKCGAKYQIPSQTQLEKGQKLKCSACDCIFFKDEEAPLPLTQTEPVPKSTEVFSEPIYRESDLSVAPKDILPSLPEAFQPVTPQPTSRLPLGLTIMAYLVVIFILCLAGWSFRELLKPSFSNTIPTPVIITKTVPAPETKVSDKQPPKPLKHSAHKQPKKSTASLPTNTTTKAKKAEPTVPSLPEVKPVATAVQPTPVVEPNQLPPTELSIPDPTVPEIKLDEIPDDTLSIPLFEVVPPTPTTTLSVESVQFQTKLNAEGVMQLLIDGKIYNKSDMPRVSPLIIANLMDAQGQLIMKKQIFVSETEIAPHQTIPFYTSITPAPEGVDHIDVKL